MRIIGSPYGIRTRVTGLRILHPKPLDEGATSLQGEYSNKILLVLTNFYENAGLFWTNVLIKKLAAGLGLEPRHA